MVTFTEENYLKALLKISLQSEDEKVGTNEVANELAVKPATATDMLKKLKEKKLVEYKKYGKILLTVEGRKRALDVVRKHRLWETFLYEKLSFEWDEVHEIAEQLEHIQSSKLVNRLDKFLGFPTHDPHGDVIPDAKGNMQKQVTKTLAEIAVGKSCKMIAVKDNSAAFLQYVMKIGLGISSHIKVVSKQPYDSLVEIEVNGKKSKVGQKFADNILVS